VSDDTETDVEADDLGDELARKYDPERLLRLMSGRAGKGQSLDHSVRAKYEKRFGVDLGHVRVITGEFAEEFNKKRDAYAVTIGSTGMILMGGSPEKSPATAAGQALLAHEITHVAQAQKGLHRKATFDSGMPFGEEHEAEAENVEAEAHAEHGGGTRAAADAESAKLKAADDLNAALEKVRERVKEMMADAARTQLWRNGSARRP
jgi:uncharacterized protein DUF4157